MSLEDSFFCEDDEDLVEVDIDVAVAGPSGLQCTKDSSSTEANGASMRSKKESFKGTQQEVVSLAKTFSNNVLADPNTCPNGSCNDAAQERSHLDASASESNENGSFILSF